MIKKYQSKQENNKKPICPDCNGIAICLDQDGLYECPVCGVYALYEPRKHKLK